MASYSYYFHWKQYCSICIVAMVLLELICDMPLIGGTLPVSENILEMLYYLRKHHHQ